MIPRIPLGPLVKTAALVGATSGAVEVALRASPRLGLSTVEVAQWLLAATALGAVASLAVALLAWRLRRWPWGSIPAALLLVHAGMAWRFEVVVNEHLYEPRVWAPLLGLAGVATVLGVALDRVLERRQSWLRRAALLVLVLGCGIGLARGRAPAGAATATGPNLVLVTLDTTRADRIGAYGAENLTPALDALAADGALFETVVATAPLTEPSHLAILSGRPPHRSGVVTNGTDIGDQPALISRLLQERGYRTAAFVSAFPVHSRYGWAQGFDVYDDDFGAWPGLHRLSLVRAWDQVALPARVLRERRGDGATGRATRWLAAQGDAPFFLWLHLFDAHGPYEAPGFAAPPAAAGEPLDLPPYWPPKLRAVTDEEWLIGAYEAEVRYVDAMVGRLVEQLDAQGLGARTLVMVTADHGESLTEHGLLFDHGDNLHDPSLLVPWIVRFQERVSAGVRISCHASNLDLTPTALALLGIDDDTAREGLDRSGELLGGPCRDVPVVATTVGLRHVQDPPVDHALRSPDRKLIRLGDRPASADTPAAPPSLSLYDLRADPGERSPVITGVEHQLETRGELAPELGLLRAALLGGDVKVAGEQDHETRAALQALGYLE